MPDPPLSQWLDSRGFSAAAVEQYAERVRGGDRPERHVTSMLFDAWKETPSDEQVPPAVSERDDRGRELAGPPSPTPPQAQPCPGPGGAGTVDAADGAEGDCPGDGPAPKRGLGEVYDGVPSGLTPDPARHKTPQTDGAWTRSQSRARRALGEQLDSELPSDLRTARNGDGDTGARCPGGGSRVTVGDGRSLDDDLRQARQVHEIERLNIELARATATLTAKEDEIRRLKAAVVDRENEIAGLVGQLRDMEARAVVAELQAAVRGMEGGDDAELMGSGASASSVRGWGKTLTRLLEDAGIDSVFRAGYDFDPVSKIAHALVFMGQRKIGTLGKAMNVLHSRPAASESVRDAVDRAIADAVRTTIGSCDGRDGHGGAYKRGVQAAALPRFHRDLGGAVGAGVLRGLGLDKDPKVLEDVERMARLAKGPEKDAKKLTMDLIAKLPEASLRLLFRILRRTWPEELVEALLTTLDAAGLLVDTTYAGTKKGPPPWESEEDVERAVKFYVGSVKAIVVACKPELDQLKLSPSGAKHLISACFWLQPLRRDSQAQCVCPMCQTWRAHARALARVCEAAVKGTPHPPGGPACDFIRGLAEAADPGDYIVRHWVCDPPEDWDRERVRELYRAVPEGVPAPVTRLIPTWLPSVLCTGGPSEAATCKTCRQGRSPAVWGQVRDILDGVAGVFAIISFDGRPHTSRKVWPAARVFDSVERLLKFGSSGDGDSEPKRTYLQHWHTVEVQKHADRVTSQHHGRNLLVLRKDFSATHEVEGLEVTTGMTRGKLTVSIEVFVADVPVDGGAGGTRRDVFFVLADGAKYKAEGPGTRGPVPPQEPEKNINQDAAHDHVAEHAVIKRCEELAGRAFDAVCVTSDGGPKHYRNRTAFALTHDLAQVIKTPVSKLILAPHHGKHVYDHYGGVLKRYLERIEMASADDSVFESIPTLVGWLRGGAGAGAAGNPNPMTPRDDAEVREYHFLALDVDAVQRTREEVERRSLGPGLNGVINGATFATYEVVAFPGGSNIHLAEGACRCWGCIDRLCARKPVPGACAGTVHLLRPSREVEPWGGGEPRAAPPPAGTGDGGEGPGGGGGGAARAPLGPVLMGRQRRVRDATRTPWRSALVGVDYDLARECLARQSVLWTFTDALDDARKATMSKYIDESKMDDVLNMVNSAHAGLGPMVWRALEGGVVKLILNHPTVRGVAADVPTIPADSLLYDQRAWATHPAMAVGGGLTVTCRGRPRFDLKVPGSVVRLVVATAWAASGTKDRLTEAQALKLVVPIPVTEENHSKALGQTQEYRDRALPNLARAASQPRVHPATQATQSQDPRYSLAQAWPASQGSVLLALPGGTQVWAALPHGTVPTQHPQGHHGGAQAPPAGTAEAPLPRMWWSQGKNVAWAVGAEGGREGWVLTDPHLGEP